MFDPKDHSLEKANCPLCQQAEGKVKYSFDPFHMVLCKDCGIFYLSPRLSEEAMKAYYRSGLYYGGSPIGYNRADYSEQERSLRLTFRALMKKLERRNLTGGSLLEVGCGYGYLLDEAKPYFSDTAGTEYSEEAIARASAYCDRLFPGGIDSIPRDDRYRAIVANQVIEHVYRPREFVRSLIDLLEPGGYLLLATPNIKSPLRYLLGKKWPSFKIPEHVILFDEKSLTGLLLDCGLTEVSRLSYRHAFPMGILNRLMPIPGFLNGSIVWIPTTTVCAYGFKGE